MIPPDDIIKPEQIRDLASAFQKSRILLTAVELDIFTYTDKHLSLADDIAEKIGTDPKATERLMNALAAMGFLRKVHGKFYNTEPASQFLVKGKPDYMGGLLHSANMWNNWHTLTDAVKEGTCIKKERAHIVNDDSREAFIAAMHYRAVKHAEIIAYMLDLKGTTKMIDIGGGSGAFAMEFCRKNPGLKGVVFDLPHIIPITKRYVEEAGMAETIGFIEGDYLESDIGSGYDFIFMSAIVHINSYEQNKTLVKKCSEALNPGGQIVIVDFIMDEDKTNPLHGTFFSINMLVATECGDTYTDSEIRQWFLDAGVSKVERKNTSFGTSLMIGRKN